MLKNARLKKIVWVFISLVGVSQVSASAVATSPLPDNLMFCERGSRSMELYESATSRLIQQDIRLRNKGRFVITVTGDGFTFEGLSYARDSYFEKWTAVGKTEKGRQKWEQSWQVYNNNYEQHVRIQLIKDSNDCKPCTARLEIKSACN